MSEIICDICCENLTQYYLCPNCKTKNCIYCFESYLTNYINNLNTSYDIQCPGCKRHLTYTDIKNICGESFSTNFIKQLAINNINDLEIRYGYLISKFEEENNIDLAENEFKLGLYLLYHKTYKIKNTYNSEVNKFLDKIKIEQSLDELLKQMINIKNNGGILEDYYDLIEEFSSEDYLYSTINHLKELIKTTITTYYPYDNFLTKKQFQRMKDNQLNIMKEKIFEFINKNAVSSIETYLKICRCNNCDRGIVCETPNMKYYVCESCKSRYCKDCMKLIETTHTCNKEDLENTKYLLKNTKPCPRCATRIEKNHGCDDMYCTYCKCGFSWKTNKYITHNFHNPHRMEDLKNKTSLLIELPDQICSEFYILSYSEKQIINEFEKELPNINYLFELKNSFKNLIKHREDKYDIKTKLFYLLNSKYNNDYEEALKYFIDEYKLHQTNNDREIISNIYDVIIDFIIKLDQLMLSNYCNIINKNELLKEYEHIVDFIYDQQLHLNYELINQINNAYVRRLFEQMKLIKCKSNISNLDTNMINTFHLYLNKDISKDTIRDNFEWLSENIKIPKDIDCHDFTEDITYEFGKHTTKQIENKESYLELPSYFDEKNKHHLIIARNLLSVFINKNIKPNDIVITENSEIFINLMKYIWAIRFGMSANISDFLKNELFYSILH